MSKKKNSQKKTSAKELKADSQKRKIKLLKIVIEDLINKQSVEIIDLLAGKKNVNEFSIAKNLNLTINQTRNILTGDITQKELTQMHITKLSDARDKIRNIEDHINREFRIIDLVEILINKLKLIGNNLDEITLENWKTPKSFIASINKFR